MNSGVVLVACLGKHSLFSVSDLTVYLCTDGLQTRWQSTSSCAKRNQNKSSEKSSAFLQKWIHSLPSFLLSNVATTKSSFLPRSVLCTVIFSLSFSVWEVLPVARGRCTFCIPNLICCCMSLLRCSSSLFVGSHSLFKFPLFSHCLIKFLSPFPSLPFPPSLLNPLLLLLPSV